jgi:hypothetical protein
MAAAGYLLLVPPRRREILLLAAAEYEGTERAVAEPVPRFDHSKNSNLVVFGSFDEGWLTHIMDGRKGASAGEGLIRLNLTRWLRLSSPLAFNLLANEIPPRFRAPLNRAIAQGGRIPPKTLAALVETVRRLAPETTQRLAILSAARANRIARFSAEARDNLALQKETLTASLNIAGIDTKEVLEWMPLDGANVSFLDGLADVQVREDTMLQIDHGVIPDFDLQRQTQIASKVFVRPSDGMRLTVLMANRTILEEQTGADLIYFNEQFKAFVFVQYKAMRKENGESVFRWRADPSDDLMKEIARMDTTLAELEKLGDDLSKESFRFHTNPFFLKLCSKTVFNPDDRGLFPGMYVPLAYWKRFEADHASRGPQGGRYASFANIGRKLNNSEFVPLVAGAWVGTTVPQSAALAPLIRRVLSENRTVTFAVQGSRPTREDPFDGLHGKEVDFDPVGGSNNGEIEPGR